MRLQSRGVAAHISCATYDTDVEHYFHLFLACPFAIACWKEVGLFHLVEPVLNSTDSFNSWLF